MKSAVLCATSTRHLQKRFNVVLPTAVQLGDSVFYPLLHHRSALGRISEQIWALGLFRQMTGDGPQSNQGRTAVILEHRYLHRKGHCHEEGKERTLYQETIQLFRCSS